MAVGVCGMIAHMNWIDKLADDRDAIKLGIWDYWGNLQAALKQCADSYQSRFPESSKRWPVRARVEDYGVIFSTVGPAMNLKDYCGLFIDTETFKIESRCQSKHLLNFELVPALDGEGAVCLAYNGKLLTIDEVCRVVTDSIFFPQHTD